MWALQRGVGRARGCLTRVSPHARPRQLSYGVSKKREPLPWVLYGVAAYCGTGLVISSYYLLTMRNEVEDACSKLRAGDAFGEARMLEGLEELCSWVEWSMVAVGVDVRPKLVARYGAENCLSRAFDARDDEARAMAFGALAGLTQDDEIARRVAGDAKLRSGILRELEELCHEHLSTSREDQWPRLYSRDASVLVAAANVIPFFEDDEEEELERAVRAAIGILRVIRDAQYAMDDAETEDEEAVPSGNNNRVASWVASLHDSVLRDMLIELETSALQLVHHASVRDRGCEEILRISGGLELLAERAAGSEDADAALHANLAMWNALKDNKDLLEEPPPAPALGILSVKSPRTALILSRAMDAVAVVPLVGAGLWGAARRIYDTQASGEAFAKHAAKLNLPRAALTAAARASVGCALLTALYGNRGMRYEFRRQLYAESDASQIALAAGVLSADMLFLRALLRVAPYSLTPFLLISILS